MKQFLQVLLGVVALTGFGIAASHAKISDVQAAPEDKQTLLAVIRIYTGTHAYLVHNETKGECRWDIVPPGGKVVKIIPVTCPVTEGDILSFQ